MRYLIADIDANGKVTQRAATTPAELVGAEEALASEELSKVDPEFLTEDEIVRVFPDGAACRFTYTEGSPPVLVAGESAQGTAALVKISGDLVRLDASETGPVGGTFTAEPLSAELHETDSGDLYDLVMTAGAEYEAGFRGQYACAGS